MPTVEEQIDNACQPGQILHLYCGFVKPPKPKFLVIVSLNPVLVFLINSKINDFKQNHPIHLACQIKINCAEHTCFNSDSYIDCTTAYTESITGFDIERIKTILSTNLSDIKSVLSHITKQKIITVVKITPLLSAIHKKSIIANLS